VRSIEPIVEKLAKAQTTFFRAADTIPSDKWNSKRKRAEWSAAEIVAHLIMVERAVVGGADRITQKTTKEIPFRKRFHLPLWLVETRLIRRKSPLPLDPGLLKNKEEMLAELRGVRERTLSFLEETQQRDLSVYRWTHAFLGMLNVYEWFGMIASHELRHSKQIKEIAACLPKAVENTQK
jgi:hypothetical protein